MSRFGWLKKEKRDNASFGIRLATDASFLCNLFSKHIFKSYILLFVKFSFRICAKFNQK